MEYVKFGTSSQGRPLEAYVITGNKKVTKTIVMDFAMHGFEDSYYRDGKVLVKEANKLIEYYSTHTNKLKNTRLVIIPALNPDGVVAGTNSKRACSTAFGRCTAKHVDMNRDFKKFKAVESKYNAKLLKKYKPDVYLNFHSWLNETIGISAICDIASSTLHLSGKQRNIYAYSSGYAIGYVHNKYGCPSALIEYASLSKVNHTNTCKFINKIISYYNVSA
ncbi:MAG: hypothetical protein LUG95_02640 [Clostridiales bacterium]|nr:hypothetical protein [Clostridiales bacterium]